MCCGRILSVPVQNSVQEALLDWRVIGGGDVKVVKLPAVDP